MDNLKHNLTVPESDAGQRLDKWLVSQLPEMSRAQLQRLIAEEQVTVNGEVYASASGKLKQGDQLLVRIPEAKPSELEPVDLQLDILFEDEHLAVINKPAGLTVHPAPGESGPTLVHGILHHCGDSLSGIGGVQRPGIVHRLDKDTSGAILIAKHDAAHQHLAAQLQDRSLSRTYHALVYGMPQPLEGVIEGDIGRHPKNRKKMAVVEKNGKPARTHYKVLELFGTEIALVECKLETGRTHQIRVHLTHIGNGLLGDPAYGKPRKLVSPELQERVKSFKRQALHAVKLAFLHPISGERVQCEAPYAPEVEALLGALSNHYK